MTLGERIQEARGRAKLTQKQLAELMEINGSRLSNWEHDLNKPDVDQIALLCGALNVPASYFIDTMEPDQLSNDEYSHIQKYRSLTTEGQKTVNDTLDNVISLEQVMRANCAPTINELAARRATRELWMSRQRVSAGHGIYLGPESFDTIHVVINQHTRRATFCVTVSGNSMEPLYHDGDILLVDSRQPAEVGEIGIFTLDGEGYVKQRGRKTLISLNSAYKPIQMDDSIRCNGKVIGVLEQNWIVAE